MSTHVQVEHLDRLTPTEKTDVTSTNIDGGCKNGPMHFKNRIHLLLWESIHAMLINMKYILSVPSLRAAVEWDAVWERTRLQLNGVCYSCWRSCEPRTAGRPFLRCEAEGRLMQISRYVYKHTHTHTNTRRNILYKK